MSLIKSQDGKKSGLTAFIVVSSTSCWLYHYPVFTPDKEWFDLESKIPFNYDFAASVFGIVMSVP